MSRDDRTDRFRPVFEPEDIFDRFVRNANASTEEVVPRDDEPTGRVTYEHVQRTAKEGAPAVSAPRPEPPAVTAPVVTAPEVMAPAGAPDGGTPEPAVPEASVPPGGAPERDLPERGVPEASAPHGRAPEPGVPEPGVPEASAPRAGAPEPHVHRPAARGGPPSWDHEITVKARSPRDGDSEGTRPDAPMPLAMARAFVDDGESTGEVQVDEEGLTVPRASPLTESGQRILLLTRVKRPGSRPPPADDPPTPAMPGPAAEPDEDETSTWDSVVSPRGLHTQRLEAMRVVPDVEETASRRNEGTFVGEGIEDGQMPTRQLDQILSDMAVLLRYGHAGQVRDRLEQLRRTYPEDLLLLRRIAEFHVEHDQIEAALETLFALAGGLFERRNVEGMRGALEQVLVLDPENARAFRLLGLLEQRPRDGAID